MANEIPSKEIGELLNEISVKVPKLILGVMQSLYSAEAGKSMGQSIGNLYRELVESGIPQEEALTMSKDYMLSIKDISGTFANANK